MKLRFFVIVFVVTSFCLTTYAGEKTHWGYSGHEGPEHWGELDPSFSLCSAGKNQSPINMTGFIEGKLKPISFNYTTGGNEILNNGHTIQVNYVPGSSIIVGGRSFELKQFHFHSPSENTIEG
jgi:carbonic anhydrase